MVLEGEDDAFFPRSVAGFFEVLHRIVEGLLLGHALGSPACKYPDDGAPDGGVVAYPNVNVGVPLVQFRAVWQGEDVADGPAAHVESVQVGLAFKLCEKLWGDFLGEEVGGGFATVEVLGGAPVDKPQHVHGAGRFRLGRQLLAEGIGRQAELKLGYSVAFDRCDGLSGNRCSKACEGEALSEPTSGNRAFFHNVLIGIQSGWLSKRELASY